MSEKMYFTEEEKKEAKRKHLKEWRDANPNYDKER